MTSQAATKFSYTLTNHGNTVLESRYQEPHESLDSVRPVELSGWYMLVAPLADGCDRVYCTWSAGRLRSLAVARPTGHELTDEQLAKVESADPGDQRLVLAAAIDAVEADRATETRVYTIHANGTLMGLYLGASIDDVLDSYAQDGGSDDFESLAELLGKSVEDARSELSVVEIDGVEVEVTSVEPGDYTPGCVDAAISIKIGGAEWSGSVTMYPDKGRHTVSRRHPLGTCGTPVEVWASDDVRECVELAHGFDGLDVVGAIEHAVDASARNAGL